MRRQPGIGGGFSGGRRSGSLPTVLLLVVVTGLATPGLATAKAARAQVPSAGPYLQALSADSVVVVWEHAAAAAPELRWGETEALDRRVSSGAPAKRHEVRLDGLAPGRTVRYALFAADGTRLTATRSFRTAPGPGAPFRFLVFGDTRSRPEVHRAVVAAMTAEPDVRFAIHTGDLVGDGDRTDQWARFLADEGPLLATVPVLPIIGNHDAAGRGEDHLRRLFVLPGAETYYATDIGNVHLVVLDAYVHVKSLPWCLAKRGDRFGGCFDDEQLAWLEDDLTRAARDPAIEHIVVSTHVGPYSSVPLRSGSAQMRALLPRFRDAGVSLIVSGHDHLYERGVTANGIPYVITGGGGAPLYRFGSPSRAPHEVVHGEATEHYVVVSVAGRRLDVTAKTPDGRVLDHFRLAPPAPPLAAPSP